MGEQIQRDVSEDGEIFIRMARANSALIFSESDIEPPVQIVFDAPMASCGGSPQLRVGRDAADEMTHFSADLLTDMAFGLHRADAAKPFPSALVVEPRKLGGAAVAPDFDPAVVAVGGLVRGHGDVGVVGEVWVGEEGLYVVV